MEPHWLLVFSQDLGARSLRGELLRVSALHYSTGSWISEGVWTVASAHGTALTYYCTSEYFYNQCPQVQKLIRTEHSLDRYEHRVIIKLECISNNSEIGVWESMMSEVTRGQVDKKTIVKVKIQTYWITYKVRVLYMKSESIAIRTGTLEVQDQKTTRQGIQEGEHRNVNRN